MALGLGHDRDWGWDMNGIQGANGISVEDLMSIGALVLGGWLTFVAGVVTGFWLAILLSPNHK